MKFHLFQKKTAKQNLRQFSDKLKTGGRFAAACIEKRFPMDR